MSSLTPTHASHLTAKTAPGASLKTPFSLIYFVLITITMSGILPLLLVASVPDAHRSTGWVITLAVMVWSGARIAWLTGVGDARLFEFVWWLFTYIFMGLAPTVQMRSGQFPGTTLGTDPAMDIPAAIAVASGVLAFEVGAGVAKIARKRTAGETSQIGTIPVSGARAVVLTITGIVLCLFLVSQVGLENLFTGRSSSAQARSEVFATGTTLATVNSFAVYGSLIGIHALTWLRRQSGRLGQRQWYALLITIALIVLLVYKNPISSPRYTFGVIAFSLIALAGAFNSVRRTRVSFIGVIVGLFGVFPVADAFRRDTYSASRLGFFEEYRQGDYDAFAQISNTLTYLDERGLNIGHQFLGVLLFWLPRSVWPGKPVDTGTLLAEFRGYQFGNISAPLWAELMINGGGIALVVGMILTGFIFVRLDRKLVPAFTVGGVWAIVGALVPFYMLLVLRGSLLQATSALVVMVIFTVALRARDKQPFTGGRADLAIEVPTWSQK